MSKHESLYIYRCSILIKVYKLKMYLLHQIVSAVDQHNSLKSAGNFSLLALKCTWPLWLIGYPMYSVARFTISQAGGRLIYSTFWFKFSYWHNSAVDLTLYQTNQSNRILSFTLIYVYIDIIELIIYLLTWFNLELKVMTLKCIHVFWKSQEQYPISKLKS